MSIMYYKKGDSYIVEVIGFSYHANIPCKDIGKVFDIIRKLRGEDKC